MKNVTMEFDTLELIEIMQALKAKAFEYFENNCDGDRMNFNYNIHRIEQIMFIYDKICKAYEQNLEEK